MATPLAMFLAVFIVGSTFAFAVEQRRGELALPRMLGGSRPQMVGLLLSPSVGIGVAVLGVLSASSRAARVRPLDALRNVPRPRA